MVAEGEPLGKEYIDADGVKYIPLTHIENHMNAGDQTRLLEYLDPEFFGAVPDALTKDADQIELEMKEKIDINLDSDDDDEMQELTEDQKVMIMNPREYQYELYQKALEDNVIVVLDTGAGKTLIAVMLIKQTSLIEREERLRRRNTKLSFFLVDRVPLVFQQASVIRTNCDVVLEHMCGEMDVDNWSEKRWRQIFEESDVCVMTAQIFLDTLRHGFISLQQVNLLIFDECHHTTKKHPYNLIMREFYDRCPIPDRPKIFGMTASPMHAKSSVETSATTLERNLDSRIYTASNIEALSYSVTKPKEIAIEYQSAPRYEDTQLTQEIRTKLGTIPRFKRCFVVTSEALQHLGPWCCDRMWKSLLFDLDRKMAVETGDLEKDALADEDLALKEAHEICDPIDFERNPDITDITKFTPKVRCLIKSLQIIIQNTTDFCGIIFVERRHTAIALKALMDKLDVFDVINSSILIGHGSTVEGDVQMQFKEQNETIEDFRIGNINLLIATNVAEEGLDIQPCNFVFRFDFFHTLIAYIQSRGRARKPGSKYILLMEGSNGTQSGMLREFRDLEKQMKEFCQELPSERNVASKFAIGDDEYFSDDSDDEDYLEGSYFIPETGATITKQNAVPLIHRYCSSLPSDSFCVLKPIYEITTTGEGFKCLLHLPSNAALTEFESQVTRSKDHAKALVSLQACKELRRVGVLDNHLIPFNYKQELLGEMSAQHDENGLVIGSKRRHGMYEKRTPKLWDRPREMEDLEEEIGVEVDEDLLRAVAHKQDDETDEEPSLNHATELLKQITRFTPLEELKAKEKEVQEKEEKEKKEKEQGSIAEAAGENATEEPKVELTELEKLNMVSLDDEEAKEVEKEEEEELGEGPFAHWMTVLEVMMKDNEFNGLPYRRICIMSKKPVPEIPQLKLFYKSEPFHVNVRPLSVEFSFDRERTLHLSDYMSKLMKSLLNKDFHCPVVDVPYYILPLVSGCENVRYEDLSVEEVEELIDWEEISNIVEFKSEPFVLDGNSKPKDKIVLDYTSNRRQFMIEDIRYDMNPNSPVPKETPCRESEYSCFQAYYEEKQKMVPTDLNQPMIYARQIRKTLNFLYPGEIGIGKIKGNLHSWVVPEFCYTYYMSASVFLGMLMVPSIMTRIDSFLLIKEAQVRYDLHMEDNSMLEAYTCPGASMEMNYERLETLGDSLLKFLATIRLYINFPFSDEGQLHHLRIRVICNRALYRAAKRLKFYRYVTSQAFNRRYWRPPHFTSPADNPETVEGLKYHKLSDKTLADIVEASLGASFITGGLEEGLHTAIQMQIPFDDIKCWADFVPTFIESRKKVPPRAEAKALRLLNLPKICEITNRTYEKPLLLVEAMTHASLPNSQAPCYQRLEFLGDAILDFLVIRYLYSKYPNADPGQITDLKDSCVNNHVLGIICLEVGLHKHIIHYSGRLVRAIEQFEIDINKTKEDGLAVGEYWRNFNIPKVLSDVVESMLGATFVDAGFVLAPVEKLFEKWFLPILDNHVTPELIKFHPVRSFINYIQRFGCEDFKLRNHSTSGTDMNSQKCVIFLHDKPLANGADSNIKIARRHAATKGLKRLKDETGLLESICNCKISLIKRGILKKPKKKAYDSDEEDE